MDGRLKTGFPGGVAGAGELHSDEGATAPGVGVGCGRGVTPHLPPHLVTLKSPCRVKKKTKQNSSGLRDPHLSGWVRFGGTESLSARGAPKARGRRTLLQAGSGQVHFFPSQPTRVLFIARAPSGRGLR